MYISNDLLQWANIFFVKPKTKLHRVINFLFGEEEQENTNVSVIAKAFRTICTIGNYPGCLYRGYLENSNTVRVIG
jgi:hypothetical protein